MIRQVKEPTVQVHACAAFPSQNLEELRTVAKLQPWKTDIAAAMENDHFS